MIKIIEIKNPFEPKREIREVEYTGKTLYSYLDPTDKEVYLCGILVTDPVNCFPQDGNELVVTPIIGKGLKSILGMVASIALAVYAPQIASSWLGIAKGATVAGSMALKLGLLTGAVMTVGGRLINSVFHLNQNSASISESDKSQSYGWTLPSVQTYEGGVIGETYGEVLPAPQLLMSHVETNNSDDEDKNVQYLNLLYCGGYGPIDSISDIRIDTTGIENFTDVQLETRLGTNNQESISFFPTTVLDQQVGITLKEGTSVTRTTETTKAKKIELTFEWPSGLYAINDSGDTVTNTAKFSIWFRKTGTNAWQSFNGQSDIKISDSKIVSNFKKKTSDVENWTISPKGDGVWGVTGSIHGKQTDAIAGQHYENEYISFDIGSKWSKFFKGKQPISVKNQTSDYTLSKATTSAVRRTYSFEMEEAGQYDILVKATSLPQTTRKVSVMQWSTISSFVMDSAYTRPGKVLVAMRIKATDQLSGSLPSVNWRQVRSKVWVFDWDVGNYVEKDATNPIWAAYDMLHNCKKLYNINTQTEEFVVEGVRANKFRAYWDEWVEAADYADEEVETTSGEKEKRFKFDAFLDTTRTRWEAAQKAASSGRGTIVRHGTNYGIKIDKPGAMMQIFGEGQIKKGSFKGQYASSDDRARSIQITYYDTQNDFKNSVFMLRAPNYIDDLTKVENSADLTLFGVTRRSQAYRDGMYALATNERQLETVTFTTDVEGMVCEYGDIIGVNHAVGQFGIASGRIIGCTENTITLDRKVLLEKNKQYSIVLRLSDDTLINREIVAVEKELITNTLTVSVAFESDLIPKQYDPYSFGYKNKEIKPFRITKIEKNGDNQVTITATEYDESVYNVDYNRYPVINYTSESVEKFSVKELLLGKSTHVQQDGTVVSDISIEWKLPTNAICKKIKIYYKTQYQSEYTLLNTFDSTDVRAIINNVKSNEVYTVKAACANDMGMVGIPVIKTIAVTGKELAPSDVSNFKVEQDSTNSSILHLTWDPNPETDIAGYRIYQGEDILVDLVKSTTQIVFIPLSGIYNYGIKAVDTSGNESNNEVKVSIEAVVSAENIAVPDIPTGVTVTVKKEQVNIAWEPVTNSYVDYYEFRTNAYPGESKGLLGKTTNITYTPELTARAGTIYIYAHNPVKKYGEGFKLDYNVPKPEPPKNIKTKVTLEGFSVTFDAVPDNCKSAIVYVDDEAFKTVSNVMYFTRDVGLYKVEVAYVDLFGEGSKSLYTQAQVTKTIDPSVLKNVKITEDNLSNSLQQTLSNLKDYDPTATVNKLLAPIKKDLNGLETTVATNKQDVQSQILQNTNAITRLVTSTSDNKNTITKIQESVDGVKTTVADVAKKQDGIDTKIVDVEHSINGVQSTVSNMESSVNSATNTVNTLTSKVTQTEKSITSVVNQLNGDPSKSEFTAITQLNNALGLKVGKGDLISSINASPDTIKIKSSLIKIDGTTQIGNNVITKNMIQTGAITADKLNVSTLSAISADFGTFDTQTKNGKVKFSGSLIEVYDKQGNIIVRIGDWSDE